MGSRSKARKRAVDLLYEADQREMDPVTLLADRIGATEVTPIQEYTQRLVEGVSEHRERIDELLNQHAEGWTLDRMPAVDRSVLRLGVGELLYGEDVPGPVVIDEAVEIVKALSTDDSPRFINGVLGRLAKLAPRLRQEEQDRREEQDRLEGQARATEPQRQDSPSEQAHGAETEEEPSEQAQRAPSAESRGSDAADG
ncbi:transcription antitermination factor NusB [Bounagaea algeriensis]